ncbi:MAG: A/G-specific adenine glycosylase [Saprospiraceae bacterium]|nr:A/G-specific adenine glycosylase [Saprospiraceae bacterium]
MQQHAGNSFTTLLLDWHQTNPRELPWKDTRDPYLIWLSEIILQQTRVEQGTPYYLRFKKAYPTVQALAKAPLDDVLKNWEGLGYYSRARNMHETARYIHLQLNNVFPNSYKELLQLKGVGPYTAAAIASFAFNLPTAVVDGNVYRVLSRYFGIFTPIDSGAGKKEFALLADQLIDSEDPAGYNQAIMNFGAIQCVPAKPDCQRCPLAEQCQAFLQEQIEVLPVKAKAKPKKDRYFNYIVINYQQQTLLEKRQEQDIWKGLYQFPLVEYEGPEIEFDVLLALLESSFPDMYKLINKQSVSKPFRQTLSHRFIHARFWEFHLNQLPDFDNLRFQLVQRSKLSNFALPRIIDWYLRDKSLYLELV